MGMFELHCEDLTRSLAKRADALCNKLLQKMTTEHIKLNTE